MHLMVGLHSSWKCVEISLQDGSVPVIGGVPLPDCNIEPAVWFKALVLDSVCIDCSDRIISWAVITPTTSSLSHQQSSSTTPSTNSPDHTLMAPHEEGTPSCPDNLHDLFEVAETLFRASPLCSPSHHPPSSSHPPSSHREDWEHMLWLRLLHTLLLPLLTLQKEGLPSLQLSLENYCNHTITSLDSNIAHSTALSQQLKEELDTVRSSLLPLLVSSPTYPYPPLLLSHLSADLRKIEDDARSKIAYCSRSLAFQSRLRTSGSPAMNTDRLQADKTLAERDLSTSMEMKSVVLSLVSQSAEDPHQPVAEDLPELTKRYLSLQDRLTEARASANHWSRKKVLALSVREAMEQAIASLQAGHVTAGMDISMHGQRSTDVLPEASHYQAREEFTTLSERIKQLLDMAHSPAAKLHNSLVQTVQMEWFPSMCNGFVLISSDMTRSLPSPRTRNRSWRRHFSFKRKRTLTSSHPSPPSPSNMAQAGKLLHMHFQEIVMALCDNMADHDTGFQQQVWLCYENLFFDNFSSSFLSHYQSENLKFCEQLRVNALSASVFPPSSLALTIPETSWLSLFPSRSFSDAILLYSLPTPGNPDANYEPPQLEPNLQTKFGPVVTDLYCMAKARAPLQKLQLLTSAFRKTMASLSTLKLESLLAEGNTDYHLAGVSCDDLLPLLVLLLLQLPPAFLCQLWLHCLLLEDCCPTFLQAGWHGYSLTTFRSSLTVISEL